MQWAYSELFQNYSARQVAGYLDHSFAQSQRVGLLVHYSETHDNERLAARGRAWSLLRNRLCALASVSGGFGFTCGVEWLATEKIDVHGCTGMAWDNPDNLVPELARLNQLLAEHPCFFDGAKLTRLSPAGFARVCPAPRIRGRQGPGARAGQHGCRSTAQLLLVLDQVQSPESEPKSSQAEVRSPEARRHRVRDSRCRGLSTGLICSVKPVPETKLRPDGKLALHSCARRGLLPGSLGRARRACTGMSIGGPGRRPPGR